MSNILICTSFQQPRRPRHAHGQSRGHPQAAHSSASAAGGTSIQMQQQPSAPPDHMVMSSHPPLPPLPTAQSAAPQLHQQSGQGIVCPNLQVHQQTSFSSIQSNPQLVVSLPPEHRSAAYLPEAPPPYPGHPPSIPPRPVRSSGKSTAVPGPSHGYGEGRGHYNRRSGPRPIG